MPNKALRGSSLLLGRGCVPGRAVIDHHAAPHTGQYLAIRMPLVDHFQPADGAP